MTNKYEKKTCIECSGLLDKDSNGEYIIIVEGKDDTQQYKVKNLLDEMCGSCVSFKSEYHED